MQYEIISTGSKGNCVVICDGQVMVDCGVPYSKIKKHLYNVRYLLLTHIHSDHIRHTTLDHIKRDFPRIKIIGNYEVHHMFGVHIIANATFPIETDDYIFTPFLCEHDVVTYGFTFLYNGKSIIYATDTSSMKNAPDLIYDYFFLESNHCEKKVERILDQRAKYGYDAYKGAKRHLSTQQCLGFYYSHRRDKNSKLIELHQSSRFY